MQVCEHQGGQAFSKKTSNFEPGRPLDITGGISILATH
jgi:cobalamin biosynthesis protein CbiD